jgi:hypothetical protein
MPAEPYRATVPELERNCLHEKDQNKKTTAKIPSIHQYNGGEAIMISARPSHNARFLRANSHRCCRNGVTLTAKTINAMPG